MGHATELAVDRRGRCGDRPRFRHRGFGGDLYPRPARSGFRHEPVPRRLRRLRGPERTGVSEQRGRALDRRQSRQSEQHDRRLAAGSLVERGFPRPSRGRDDERRRELDDRERPQDVALYGRDRSERRRLPACHRPLGDLRADRYRLPAEPVVQRRGAAVHGVRLRPRASRLEVDERRPDLERTGHGHQGHGADGVQRQADDHRRSDGCALCVRGLGPARLPRERARERRGLVPHELVQRSCLVRPVR